MANETLTFNVIRSWDAVTTRKNFADPTMRPDIDRVIAEHAAEVLARATEQNDAIGKAEAERLERQRAHEAEAMQAQKEAELERERLLRMTPAERQAEREAAEAAKREEDQRAHAEEVARKKDEAYLQSLPPLEKKAELERRQIALDQAEKEAAEAQAAAEKVDADKVAAEAAQKAADEKAATDAVVAAEAEKKSLEEATRIAAEEAAKPKQKIVEDFQATDEDGTPIGRRTHLEADTEEEMRAKMKESYVNAVRYSERLKKKKAQAVPRQIEPIISTLSAEELAQVQKDVAGADETKATAAKLKLELDEIRHEKIRARQQAESSRQEKESYLFMKKHSTDFNPCEANAKVLAQYIQENNLEWNATNLELAFEEKSSELAQPERKVQEPDPTVARAEAEAEARAAEQLAVEAKAKADAEEARKKIEQEQAAANTAAASASVAAAAPVVAASTPEEKATAAANTAVPARKLPAGGIEPGSLHGGRPSSTGTPTAKTASQIKQEITKMMKTSEGRIEFRKKLRDPNFRKYLNSAGIQA